MKHLKVGLTLLFILLVILPFLLFPRLTVVKKIECLSQYGRCDETVYRNLAVGLGKSFSEMKFILKSVLSTDSLVDSYSYRLKLPDTIRVDIIARKGQFAMQKKDAPEFAVVDKDGFVLATVKQTNLPLIVVPEDLPKVREKVKEDRLFALDLIYRIYYFYQVRTAEVGSDNLFIVLPSGTKVIFPLSGDKNVLLGSLRFILFRLNQAGEDSKIGKIQVIDLRYKNPIII